MERRKHSRHKIDAVVEVEYGSGTFDARTLDISKHGIRIESDYMVDPESKVDIVLFINEPVSFSGEIKWVFSEHAGETISYLMGIYCKGTDLSWIIENIDHY